MSLKNQIKSDLDLFFNIEEFAELHDIDGLQISAVVDSDTLKVRSDRRSERYDGIYKGKIAVYVKDADLPSRTVYGQHMRLDGKLYLVAECTENMGVLEITLEANES